jgi:hypothetical protein
LFCSLVCKLPQGKRLFSINLVFAATVIGEALHKCLLADCKVTQRK